MDFKGEDKMKKRKCLKEHYVPYFETYCQVGRTFWRFDYIKTIHYCYFCNKIRVQRKLYFNIPKIFKKDDELPF